MAYLVDILPFLTSIIQSGREAMKIFCHQQTILRGIKRIFPWKSCPERCLKCPLTQQAYDGTIQI